MRRLEEQVIEGLKAHLDRNEEPVPTILKAAKLLTTLRKVEAEIDHFHLGRP